VTTISEMERFYHQCEGMIQVGGGGESNKKKRYIREILAQNTGKKGPSKHSRNARRGGGVVKTLEAQFPNLNCGGGERRGEEESSAFLALKKHLLGGFI